MAFSYWRTGTYPANQGAQGTQRNNGFDCYGQNGFTGWGRGGWNKWAWSGSCLRTDAIMGADTNLLWNGTFDSNSIWALTNATISGGLLNFTGAFPEARQTGVAFVTGQSYTVTFTVTAYTSGEIRPYFIGGSGVAGTARTAVGTYTETMYADSGNTDFVLGSGGFVGSVDDVSVRPVVGIIAAVGSYVLTGTATGLAAGRKLAAAVGSYSISGQTVGLSRTRSLAAAPGSYSIAGTVTTLRAARTLAASVGSYAITGTATALRIARKTAAAVGGYSITGTATGLKLARTLAGAAGSYTISGTTVGLQAARQLAPAVGAYALSGSSVALRVARRHALASGLYLLTGNEIDLIHTSLWNEDGHPGSIGLIRDFSPADLVLVPDPALSLLEWE